MIRKRILKTASMLAGIVLLLAACGDEHNTPHPTQGAVTVHTDYEDDYYLRIDNHRFDMQGSPCTAPEYLEPGEYTFVLYNLPEGFGESDNTSSGIRTPEIVLAVDRLPDGTIQPQPGTLHAVVTQGTVVADDTLHLDFPLQPRTRQLTLRLTATTGDAMLLSEVEAKLTGVAQAMELFSLKLRGEAAEVKPIFTREGNILTAPLNLLGILPAETQYLTVKLTNRDGQTQTLEFDLTGPLANFNEGSTPLTLDANLLLMEGGEFDFSITDWTESEEDDNVDAV